MKLNRLLLILGVAALGAFTSCKKDNAENGIKASGDLVEASFRAGIQTRATDGNWDNGDAVGITMIQNDAVYGEIFNYKYTTADGGALFRPAAGQTIYFPADGSTVSFRAYYPYLETLTDDLEYPVSVANQSSLAAIDFMTADFENTYSKTANVVNVKFYHRLTKLNFELSKDASVATNLRDFTLTIEGMNTTGTYDIMDDVLTDNDSKAGIVVLPDSSYDFDRTAIVLPRPTAGTGVKFVFTNGTERYEAEMPADIELLSKTAYLLKIKLSQTAVEFSATVVDWEDGDPIELVSVTPGTTISGGKNVKDGEELTVYTGNGTARTQLAKFVYSGSDEYGTWTATPAVYWEEIALPTTFYGLITGDYEVPDDSNQMEDYIVATPLSTSVPTGLDFTLSHVGSKVTVQITSGTYTPEDFTITLPNYDIGGTMDNGVFVPGRGTGDIAVPVTDGSAVALIQPQKRTKGSNVVRLDYPEGATRTFNITSDEDIFFDPGYAYVLNITINKNEVEISATVIDWIDAEEIELNGNPGAISVGTTTGVADEALMNVFTGTADARTALTDFTYSETSGEWTPEETKYWEDVALPTSFYGVITGQQAIAETNQLTDYMVATPIAVSKPQSLAFELSHVASKVTVQVRSASQTYELDDFTVSLPGYTIGGEMQSGLFVAGSGTGTISVPVNDEGVATALILPQTRSINSTVVSLLYSPQGGTPTTFDVPTTQNIVFEAGKAYVIIIDIDKTPLTISAKVIDWEQASEIQLIATGIKVTGTLDNTSDFFERKSIKVYETLPAYRELTYTYEPVAGQTYWAWNTSNPLYWDDISASTSVNMLAVYYPFQDLIPTNITALSTSIPWTVPAGQSGGYADYDILTDSLILKTPTYANFKFGHALAKVKVVVTAPQFTADQIAGMQVTLKNFIVDGGVSLSNGGTISGTTRSDITPMTETADAVFSALVFPDKMTAGTTALTVKLPNYPSSFEGKLKLPVSFEAGKVTTINVVLTLTEIELSGTVEPWGDAGTGEIEIK